MDDSQDSDAITGTGALEERQGRRKGEGLRLVWGMWDVSYLGTSRRRCQEGDALGTQQRGLGGDTETGLSEGVG